MTATKRWPALLTASTGDGDLTDSTRQRDGRMGGRLAQRRPLWGSVPQVIDYRGGRRRRGADGALPGGTLAPLTASQGLLLMCQPLQNRR